MLEGDQPDGPTRELLDSIDAPVRDATSLSGGQSCVQGVALGDRIDPAEVEMVVRVTGEASPDRVEDPATDAGDAFRAGEPEADGDLGRLTLTYAPRPGVATHPSARRPSRRPPPLPRRLSERRSHATRPARVLLS